MMQPSEQAFALIRSCEGFSPKPIPDAGRMQIGYGHDIRPGELFTEVNAAQAERLLAGDVKPIGEVINRLVTKPLNQNQFDALVSLIYNIGIEAFDKSTLLRFLNAGYMEDAAGQFSRWVYSNGQVNIGLVTRRNREKALFDRPVAFS